MARTGSQSSGYITRLATKSKQLAKTCCPKSSRVEVVSQRAAQVQAAVRVKIEAAQLPPDGFQCQRRRPQGVLVGCQFRDIGQPVFAAHFVDRAARLIRPQ